MTTDEQSHILYLLQNLWTQGKFTDDNAAAYMAVLGHLDHDLVQSALGRASQNQPKFRPSAFEILAAMEPAIPPFQEVMASIGPVLKDATVHGERRCVALIRERVGDVVAGWVASYGAVRLALEPVFDPDFGGAVLKRIERTYDAATGSPEMRRLTANRADALEQSRQRQLSEAS